MISFCGRQSDDDVTTIDLFRWVRASVAVYEHGKLAFCTVNGVSPLGVERARHFSAGLR